MPHEFASKLSRIMNAGKSRSVVLWGNVNDLFYDGQEFVPLVDFLSKRYALKPTTDGDGKKVKSKGITQLILEINQAVRVVGDVDELRATWNAHYQANPRSLREVRRSQGYGLRESVEQIETEASPYEFDRILKETGESLTLALEFLRRMTTLSQQYNLKSNLLVVIEGAQYILPDDTLAHMSESSRKRLAVVIDWFSDPKFSNGHDSVVFITESRSLLHSDILRLPQVRSLEVPPPNLEERKLFAGWFGKEPLFAEQVASLTLHAYRQVLLDGSPSLSTVVDAVEQYMVGLLGEGVVEYIRPEGYSLEIVKGAYKLVQKIQEEYIPRLKSKGVSALPGLTFAGPLGGGKTFLGKAICAELGIPIMVLKNFRNMYYGQTDVAFERIRSLILGQVADGGQIGIFVDEADTAIPNIGPESHETERRIGGKFLQLMGDPALRGKVIWFLMTARIHMLAPDVRREGRPGEIIIPILDPFEFDDRSEFLELAVGPKEQFLDTGMSRDDDRSEEVVWASLLAQTQGFSPAQFNAIKSDLAFRTGDGQVPLTVSMVEDVLDDIMPGAIGKTRRYQTLQALLNCKRKSLLPDGYPIEPDGWQAEIAKLEAEGIR